jgi:hypothetical protein
MAFTEEEVGYLRSQPLARLGPRRTVHQPQP